MKRIIFSLFAFCISSVVFAQNDTNKIVTLLTNLRVQMECTEAMDSLYNGNFLVAESQFSRLQQQYPEHPLGDFLMALSQRWKIMPNDEETKFDAKFYEYLEITIDKALDLYKKEKKNPEAAFFLACAYGLKAQRLEENGKPLSAVFPAEKASDYIVKNLEVDEIYGPEFNFGKGLYNYFREWIPLNKKSLKPIIMTFRKGNMTLGIDQLQETANTAFYTRVEALVYLMDIYNGYGVYNEKKEKINTSYKAFEISKNLYRNYNLNKYFERRYAEMCIITGNDEQIGLEIMRKNLALEFEKEGTLDTKTLRNFSYFYASDLWAKGDKQKASSLFEIMVRSSEKIDLMDANYTMTALYNLAKYNLETKNKEKALEYYKLLEDNYDNNAPKSYKDKHKPNVKEAKIFIKNNTSKKFFGIF